MSYFKKTYKGELAANCSSHFVGLFANTQLEEDPFEGIKKERDMSVFWSLKGDGEQNSFTPYFLTGYALVRNLRVCYIVDHPITYIKSVGNYPDKQYNRKMTLIAQALEDLLFGALPTGDS